MTGCNRFTSAAARRRQTAMATTALGLLAMMPALSAAAPAFVIPGAGSWPTENWTRGDANTTYGEWDEFFIATGPNEPDVSFSGFVDPFDANVKETTDPPVAFVTSTGNIYSNSGVTLFEATLPGPNAGATGFDTFFVAQFNTLGSELDSLSVKLSYDGGSQELSPDGSVETQRIPLPGGPQFGGADVTTIFWWEITGDSPDEFLLDFGAGGSSMSLAALVLDSYSVGASAIPGDYDGSGIVDSGDLVHWNNQFGASVGSGLSGAGDGADGNADGVVNGADYAFLRNLWPAPAAVSAVTVPEPGGFAMAGMLMIAASFCGWVSWFTRPPRF